jgi:hypothetical protein
MTYEFWKFIHIFMLTFWLGTDMGVMIATKKSADPSLSPETRYKMMEMALIIELLPRIMWTLAFAFGVHLSKETGYLVISDTMLTLVWAVTGVLFITNVGSAFLIGKPLGEKLTKINSYLVPLFGVSVFLLGAWSYFGNGPFQADWLGVKLMVFGVINITAISILWVFEPTVVYYIRLLQEGSSPEIEEGIKKGVAKTLIPVYTTYILIAVVAYFGVFKPL